MICFGKRFRDLGFESEIYSEHVSTSVRSEAQKFNRYKPSDKDLLIYHHSIHSEVLSFLLDQNAPKVLIYHNVTPAYFYEPYDLQFSYILKRGREELSEIKDQFVLSFAVSDFNAKELEHLGYQDVKVIPIAYDFESLNIPHVNRNKYEGKKILFVGRIAPNKKQDDLIRFAEIFKKYFRDDFQIQIVGYSSPSTKTYQEELFKLVQFWNLENHIHFSGYVTLPELVGYFKNSDLFFSMSEHEGFCVPILESMYFNLPIVAYSAGAIPETLGGSGILFKEKNFAKIGEMIEEILVNERLRSQIIKKQNQVIEKYRSIDLTESFIRAIRTI
jgi:glycosyltransferase involved in cell wall biosynthesis